MKRLFLWCIAFLAIVYVLVMGPLIDPLPLLDEATALAVFAYAMRALGYDVARWLPFVGRFRGGISGRRRNPVPPPSGPPPRPKPAEKEDVIIDV